MLRLTHPTINPEAVPGEVIAATVHDLEQALAELDEDELEGLRAAGKMARSDDAEILP